MKFVQILPCKKYVLLKGRIHQAGRREENGRKQRGRNRKLQEGQRWLKKKIYKEVLGIGG